MYKNQAKKKLLGGDTIYGVFCNLYSPMIVELIGHIGFDFVLADAEHGPSEVESCEHMVRAANSAGVPIFIRVAMNIQQNILRYLDTGAQGIQLPMVNTRAEAEAVVQAVKYPPQGRRGLAATRAADYGLKMSLEDYTIMANEETLVVVQLETIEAMDNLGDMLSVEGIDVFFIGPNDLSTSMGYIGQVNHPKVQAAIKRLVEEIHAAGKVAGTTAYNDKALARAKEQRFQYIVYNVIPMMVKSGQEYLKMAHND